MGRARQDVLLQLHAAQESPFGASSPSVTGVLEPILLYQSR